MLIFAPHLGEYQSGQMGQTVNLLVFTFGGSNPSSPTKKAVSTDSFFCIVTFVTHLFTTTSNTLKRHEHFRFLAQSTHH